MEDDESPSTLSELEMIILRKRMEKIKMDELFQEPSTWEDDEHFY